MAQTGSHNAALGLL